MLCYGTNVNIKILLTCLLKISLAHFMALASCSTFGNTSENSKFPNVLRGHCNRPVPWNGLRVMKSLVTYFATF